MVTAIDTAFQQLDRLDLASIESRGDWGLGQMFSHLAQGVTFSMTGYPVQKPRLFQSTVGTLAFKVFELRGKMSHGLDEPIPGEVLTNLSAEDGFQQLHTALEAFKSYDGDMQPHFAYGRLSKAKFGTAHLFHINNHLEEIVPRG
jgi:hypothetical protein